MFSLIFLELLLYSFKRRRYNPSHCSGLLNLVRDLRDQNSINKALTAQQIGHRDNSYGHHRRGCQATIRPVPGILSDKLCHRTSGSVVRYSYNNNVGHRPRIITTLTIIITCNRDPHHNKNSNSTDNNCRCKNAAALQCLGSPRKGNYLNSDRKMVDK